MNLHKSPDTLAEAIEDYLTWLGRSYSPQTSTAYSQALHLFRQFAQDELDVRLSIVPPGDLSTSWACEFLTHLQDTRSIETEHLYSRAILHFYQEAVRREWAELELDDLSTYFTQNRRQKKHEAPDIPFQAIEQVLQCVKRTPLPPKNDTTQRERLRLLRDKAFLPLLAETGLRISEICNLRRHHISLPRARIMLNPVLPIELSNTTHRFLASYLSERRSLDEEQPQSPEFLPLFSRHDKRVGNKVLPISRWTGANIVEDWTTYALDSDALQSLEANGQRITPHTFRHYFVYTMLSQTGNLDTARSLSRHVDPATTKRYLNFIESRQDGDD